ncbi:hypothetical protein ES703_63208 [subsurface metagenome]
MLPLDYPFRVQTGSSRRPTPTTFVHLRKYAAKDENFLILHSQEEITNINYQLDQTTNLQISNIISRVIAQLIGETSYGFATIKATPDGALHVIQAGDLSKTKIYGTAPIDISSPADNIIITATPGTQIKVVFLMFTVAGEVDIILKTGTTPKSGPMDFGAANQPMGIVAPHGPGPFVCETAEDFIINLSAAIQVSGYCTYYKE